MSWPRLLPLVPGAACVLLLSMALPTDLWLVPVAALVTLGLSVAVAWASPASLFALLLVALAALQRGTIPVWVLTVAGVLLGLYLVSLGARVATDARSLRTWLYGQWPQVVGVFVGVAAVPLGLLLPVGAPLIAVAAGGVSLAVLFWWARSWFVSV